MTGNVIPMSNRTPSPAFVAAVTAVMATAWHAPAEVSETSLLKAHCESLRFIYEWNRLTVVVESEADQRAIQPIFDHANELVEYLLSAPVLSAATAAASMRHLITDISGMGIDASDPGDLHMAAFRHILEWLEAQATRGKK